MRGRADGANPGDQAYISAFQASLSVFLDDLDEEKILELEQKRAKWEKESHPVEVQRKRATRLARNTLQASAESQYKEMGMRSVVWEFHENNDGAMLFQLLSSPVYFWKYISDIHSTVTILMII